MMAEQTAELPDLGCDVAQVEPGVLEVNDGNGTLRYLVAQVTSETKVVPQRGVWPFRKKGGSMVTVNTIHYFSKTRRRVVARPLRVAADLQEAMADGSHYGRQRDARARVPDSLRGM